MTKINYSFKQMCIDNNRMDILNRWDYEKNNIDPDDVSAHTNIKRWLKCPRQIHESELYNCDYISSKQTYTAYCRACNSFAQYIIDKYGENYLSSIWSDKNEKSPWEYDYMSNKDAWFICIENRNHVYQQAISHRSMDCLCPYCDNRNIHTGIAKEKCLGILFPNTLDVWSDKNEKTPFDYSPSSEYMAWWKCENNKHEDYQRTVANSNPRGFKCPKCAWMNRIVPKGNSHYNWQGGLTDKDRAFRKTPQYKEWRQKVYERDNYICQICLDKTHSRLQAHHFYSFAKYKNLRCDVSNGLTLCIQCHDSRFKGSFHQLYGAHDNTPEQLQEYANKRRAELGITEPFDINTYMNPTLSSIPYPEELPPDLEPTANIA